VSFEIFKGHFAAVDGDSKQRCRLAPGSEQVARTVRLERASRHDHASREGKTRLPWARGLDGKDRTAQFVEAREGWIDGDDLHAVVAESDGRANSVEVCELLSVWLMEAGHFRCVAQTEWPEVNEAREDALPASGTETAAASRGIHALVRWA
jgi:hypothetical protein